MNLAEIKAAIRAHGHLPTPWRMGCEMGRRHMSEMALWRARAKQSGNYDSRPSAPECPYSNAISVRNWNQGFRSELKP